MITIMIIHIAIMTMTINSKIIITMGKIIIITMGTIIIITMGTIIIMDMTMVTTIMRIMMTMMTGERMISQNTQLNKLMHANMFLQQRSVASPSSMIIVVKTVSMNVFIQIMYQVEMNRIRNWRSHQIKTEIWMALNQL